jgi:hypothetical protein
MIEKEARWTVWKVVPLFLILVVVFGGIGFFTRSIGLWGGTIVEQKVFEASYQRKDSIKARIAADTAVITEIESKLMNPNLDANTRYNLEAQLSAARVRIATAENMK